MNEGEIEIAAKLGLDISNELEAFVLMIRKMERDRCWHEVNKYIRTGDLGGNGTNKNAERNGIILATNIISGLH